jgi:hypothetical protein
MGVNTHVLQDKTRGLASEILVSEQVHTSILNVNDDVEVIILPFGNLNQHISSLDLVVPIGG